MLIKGPQGNSKYLPKTKKFVKFNTKGFAVIEDEKAIKELKDLGFKDFSKTEESETVDLTKLNKAKLIEILKEKEIEFDESLNKAGLLELVKENAETEDDEA